jgi:hypothetical protein
MGIAALPCMAAEESPTPPIGNGTNTTVPQDDGSCHRFFDAMYVRLLAIVNDRKSSAASKRDATAKVYQDSLDAAWIAQFAAGDLWEQARDAERKAYLGAFKAYLRDADRGPGSIDEKTMASVTDLPLIEFHSAGPGIYKGEIEVMAADEPLGEMAYYLAEVAKDDCRLRDIAFNSNSILYAQKAFIRELGATGGLSAATEQLTRLPSARAASSPATPSAADKR